MTQYECMTLLSHASHLCQNFSPAFADWRDFEGCYLGCSVLILTVRPHFYGFYFIWVLGVFWCFSSCLIFSKLIFCKLYFDHCFVGFIFINTSKRFPCSRLFWGFFIGIILFSHEKCNLYRHLFFEKFSFPETLFPTRKMETDWLHLGWFKKKNQCFFGKRKGRGWIWSICWTVHFVLAQCLAKI